MNEFLKPLLPALTKVAKTAVNAVLAIVITALIQQYAPKLELPAVGAVAATAAARKSTLVD